jgi:phenylacetate-coenzyme A ligase PaaK-like adenylate-forming protein
MAEYPQEYYNKSLKVLEAALSSVPAYRDWQKFDPGYDKPIDLRYAAMPCLHKAKIRENFPDGFVPAGKDVRAALERGEISTASTSGSSDIPAVNIWNQEWWDASERASWKLNSHASRLMTGTHPEAILANPLNVGVVSDNTELPMEQRRLDRFLYLNEMTDPARWSPAHMDRIIEELDLFKPVSLEANPSLLARLSRYASATGKKIHQPGLIVFTYEYPSRIHYRQIQRVFSSPTVSSYGSTETSTVFMQCEEGKFHHNHEFCRVDFQPFKPEFGGPSLGRLLVTTFGNPWYYMLRFDIRDLVRVDQEGSCSCGRNSGLILSAVEGRAMSVTLTVDGRPVTLRALDDAVSSIEDIEEYRLEQVTRTDYTIYISSERADASGLKADVIQLLHNLYGKEANVSVVFCRTLSPEDSGKYALAKVHFPIDINSLLE